MRVLDGAPLRHLNHPGPGPQSQRSRGLLALAAAPLLLLLLPRGTCKSIYSEAMFSDFMIYPASLSKYFSSRRVRMWFPCSMLTIWGDV